MRLGQDRTERRSRLHPRVPVLGGFVLVPRHVAQIVDRPTDARPPRGRRSSAARRRASRACAPASRYRRDDSGCCAAPHGSPRCRASRRPARPACAACRSARGERPAHLGEELVVEPAASAAAPRPARSGSRGSRRRSPSSLPRVSSRNSAMIAGARHRRMAFLDQHRRRAGRIEQQEFLAPLPDPLLDQARARGRIRRAPAGRSANAGRTDDGTA